MGNTPPSASPVPSSFSVNLSELQIWYFYNYLRQIDVIYISVLEITLELGRFSASNNLTLKLGEDF